MIANVGKGEFKSEEYLNEMARGFIVEVKCK
jgi:hypothetical protein